MTDQEAFKQAILEAPKDDAPRLVYADWLDEQGDPTRAEFIRVQCRLARWTNFKRCPECNLERHWGWRVNNEGKFTEINECDNGHQWKPDDHKNLKDRQTILLSEHGAGWVEEIADTLGIELTDREFIKSDGIYQRIGVGGRIWIGVEFVRGLFGKVSLSTRTFLGRPCTACEGRTQMVDPVHDASYSFTCTVCHGSGYVSGSLAAPLFKFFPLIDVDLTDVEYREHGFWAWCIDNAPTFVTKTTAHINEAAAKKEVSDRCAEYGLEEAAKI